MEYHHPPCQTNINLDCTLIDLWEMGIQYDPHDTKMMWYDVGINKFIDSDTGLILHDIHRLLEPWKIAIFKQKKTGCIFPDVTNSFLIELVYPDHFYIKHS